MAEEHWAVYTISDEVTLNAKRTFPVEPIRTLDAIHLATFFIVRGDIPEMVMLSLDQRIRENATALAIQVYPDPL